MREKRKRGMKADKQTGRDLKPEQKDETEGRQERQTRSQTQRDVGEGSNTLLLIPLLLCCEEPHLPF